MNTDFGVVSGLSAAQFNAISSGRYAPGGFWGFVTGYGSSLHVVGGPSKLDPTAMNFSNRRLGGCIPFTNSANGQNHIMQNHVGGGMNGKSVYAGDWTAIQALNSSTLSFGYLAPSIFQRTGSITQQWAAPQSFKWMGISNYIGYDPSGNLTTTNRLVVLSNCKTVVTSYPVPD